MRPPPPSLRFTPPPSPTPQIMKILEQVTELFAPQMQGKK
jgi:hypothetical protein